MAGVVTINDLLCQLLTIAKYPYDPELFIRKFETFNRLEAIISVVKTLPEECQKVIRAQDEDPTEMLNYIPEEAFLAEYERITINELISLLQTLSPMLTRSQKQAVVQLFATN